MIRTAATLAVSLRHAPAVVAPPTAVASLAGMALAFTPVEAEEQAATFAWGPGTGTGLTAFAAHEALGLVAYAPNCANPAVYVLAHPSLDVLATLEASSELTVSALAFSPSSEVLAVLSHPPHPVLTLWRWQTGERLASVVVSDSVFPALSQPYARVLPRLIFDVADETRLVIVANGSLALAQYEQFNPPALRAVVRGLELNDGHEVQAACWATGGTLILGTAGGALLAWPLVDAGDGTAVAPMLLEEAVESNSGGVAAVVFTDDETVVTGGADGVLRWFTLSRNEADGEVCGATVTGLQSLPSSAAIAHVIVAETSSHWVVVNTAGETYMRREANSDFALVASGVTQPATALAPFPTTHAVALATAAGTISVWNYVSGFHISSTRVDDPVSVLGHAPLAPLLAAGSYNGVVRLFDVTEATAAMAPPRLVFRRRLHAKAVTTVVFSPDGRCMASGGIDGRILVVVLDASSETLASDAFPVLRSVELGSPVVSAQWSTVPNAGGSSLLVVTAAGNVVEVRGADGPAQTAVSLVTMNPDFPVVAALRAPSSSSRGRLGGSGRGSVFALAMDGAFKTYTLPERQTDITPANAEYAGHAKPGGVLSLAPNSEWVATGGSDGAVMLRPAGELGKAPISLVRHGSAAHGVGVLAWSYDSQYLFSAGPDGGVFAFVVSYPSWWSVPESEVPALAGLALLPTLEADSAPTASEPDVVVAEALKVAKAEAQQKLAVKAARLTRVSSLQTRFQVILDANRAVLPIEQLEEEAFVVDPEWVALTLKAGDQAAFLESERLRFANINVDAACAAIISSCWEAMSEAGLRLKGFDTPVIVASYPLPRSTAEGERAVAKIRVLRRVELAAEAAAEEEAAKAAASAVSNNSPNVRPPLGSAPPPSPLAALRHPQRRRRASVISLGLPSGGSGAGSVGSPGSELGSSFDMESQYSDDGEGVTKSSLLYSPFQLNTRNRQISQMHMLRHRIRATKRKFNAEARRVLKAKAAAISAIEERNERIAVILSELDEPGEVVTPALSAEEMPSSVLSVSDAEMGIERFVPPEEVAAAEAARAAEEARLLLERGDDSGERALEEMMYGKVEERTKDALQVSLERPEWMDKPTTELTEEEVRAVKEFEARVQEAQEEAQKYRRALETELKKLRVANAEERAGFDATLAELFNARLRTDMSVCEDELRIIKLASSLLQRSRDAGREAALVDELEGTRVAAADAAHELAEFEAILDAARGEYEAARAEEAALEREFKTSLAGEDFHRKALFEVSDAVWDRVWTAREERAELDEHVRRCGGVVAKVRAQVAEVEAQAGEAAQAMDAKLAELNAFREERARSFLNLEIQLTLKQGQDEASLGRNVMVDRSLVERLNTRIRELGEARLGILEEIKDVKARVALVEWEVAKNALVCSEIADEIRDFQLLRVTKSLQELIKGGGTDKRATEVANLERRLAAAAANHESRRAELGTQLGRVQAATARVREENALLESRERELVAGVEERRRIASVQAQREDGGASAREKRVRAKRRLVERLKMGKAELERLQAEADIVRAKVWPRL
ncbi:uncharacterized protein AMSG_01332 [Thecamonas trahens ATCC 50062]|uniref:Uncharacterized protein n=1 Tax=Thecamonas trahens ATCC 50062 TaxID=461836 RepID=A0A0L0DQE1_THETB|nr:hypothetical protein AMSG_01332 [Thecamonas trahens ATCC 50062]KNC53623.1 hypothetical protein AMSG_01332 [Thecamonas trahens ATCC 50062]|eukprot:XP_013761940.1 hypothetical protein AMSG_01332 [Thecamonas trahens ATCC 50062]